MANVLWLQGGTCSGDTMSFLNAEEPTACDLISDFGINLLWHPSLGMEMGEELKQLLQDCVSGKIPVDIFVFEGTVINAPNGTGEWNRFADRPMKKWVEELAAIANFVVAVGACASWGGIPAMEPNPSESQGLQYTKKKAGGFLGADFRSLAGLPVINIPGCPAHPDWISQVLVAVATGRVSEIELDKYHRPKAFYNTFTQTGCTRNLNFTYRASAIEFGQPNSDCLFYDLGCRGPMTHSSCNTLLWNRVSSKTRAGAPCIGCTEPAFPFHELKPGTVFKTPTVMGVPKELPPGVKPKDYALLTMVAKGITPEWVEED
ncbi:MAG: hypothetical protein QNJ54_31580 [Prochloraceae cyanobacterium]|nr:hypothetical protein [Prochloraceae cyanobacterium]